MPIAKYNKFFGGNAAKARRAMIDQYGPVKADSVFYAVINKKKQESGLAEHINDMKLKGKVKSNRKKRK